MPSASGKYSPVFSEEIFCEDFEGLGSGNLKLILVRNLSPSFRNGGKNQNERKLIENKRKLIENKRKSIENEKKLIENKSKMKGNQLKFKGNQFDGAARCSEISLMIRLSFH